VATLLWQETLVVLDAWASSPGGSLRLLLLEGDDHDFMAPTPPQPAPRPPPNSGQALRDTDACEIAAREMDSPIARFLRGD
jgi:hypothetical protein